MIAPPLSFPFLRLRGGIPLSCEEVTAAAGVVVDELPEFSCWLALLADQGELGGTDRRPSFVSAGVGRFAIHWLGISLGTFLIRGGFGALPRFLAAGGFRVKVVVIIALLEMLNSVDVDQDWFGLGGGSQLEVHLADDIRDGVHPLPFLDELVVR